MSVTDARRCSDCEVSDKGNGSLMQRLVDSGSASGVFVAARRSSMISSTLSVKSDDRICCFVSVAGGVCSLSSGLQRDIQRSTADETAKQ